MSSLPPVASAAVWGVAVLALVLLNSGSLVLAVLLAAVVAGLSWWISDRSRSSGS